MVVTGTPTLPDSTIQYAANVAAEFLDPQLTGKPVNEAIRNAFSLAEGGVFMGGGIDQASEDKACNDIGDNGYCFSF